MAVHLNEAPLHAVRDDGGVHQERREIAEEVGYIEKSERDELTFQVYVTALLLN